MQTFRLLIPVFIFAIFAACSGQQDAGIQVEEGERSQEQFSGAELEITSPGEGRVFEEGESVNVEFDVSGFELQSHTPGYEEKGWAYSDNGQHIHVIRNQGPYNAIYENSFTLEDLEPGIHRLHAFPSRSWHESVKSPGAYDHVTFFVGEESENPLNFDEPYFVYSRPKGQYTGDGASDIMFDFYLQNAELGEDAYRLELEINGEHVKTITSWVPHHITGLPDGTHEITATLVDPDGNEVDNGINPVTREITVGEE